MTLADADDMDENEAADHAEVESLDNESADTDEGAAEEAAATLQARVMRRCQGARYRGNPILMESLACEERNWHFDGDGELQALHF